MLPKNKIIFHKKLSTLSDYRANPVEAKILGNDRTVEDGMLGMNGFQNILNMIV